MTLYIWKLWKEEQKKRQNIERINLFRKNEKNFSLLLKCFHLVKYKK